MERELLVPIGDVGNTFESLKQLSNKQNTQRLRTCLMDFATDVWWKFDEHLCMSVAEMLVELLRSHSYDTFIRQWSSVCLANIWGVVDTNGYKTTLFLNRDVVLLNVCDLLIATLDPVLVQPSSVNIDQDTKVRIRSILDALWMCLPQNKKLKEYNVLGDDTAWPHKPTDDEWDEITKNELTMHSLRFALALIQIAKTHPTLGLLVKPRFFEVKKVRPDLCFSQNGHQYMVIRTCHEYICTVRWELVIVQRLEDGVAVGQLQKWRLKDVQRIIRDNDEHLMKHLLANLQALPYTVLHAPLPLSRLAIKCLYDNWPFDCRDRSYPSPQFPDFKKHFKNDYLPESYILQSREGTEFRIYRHSDLEPFNHLLHGTEKRENRIKLSMSTYTLNFVLQFPRGCGYEQMKAAEMTLERAIGVIQEAHPYLDHFSGLMDTVATWITREHYDPKDEWLQYVRLLMWNIEPNREPYHLGLANWCVYKIMDVTRSSSPRWRQGEDLFSRLNVNDCRAVFASILATIQCAKT